MSEWTCDHWQLTSTPHSPKPQAWSLTIRLFDVIFRRLVGRVLLLSTDAFGWFYHSSRLGLAFCIQIPFNLVLILSQTQNTFSSSSVFSWFLVHFQCYIALSFLSRHFHVQFVPTLKRHSWFGIINVFCNT